MAKVTAPLGSFSASGKIGKALVFFSHLGRNVVRGLVTPANPQTVGQGDSRLLLGALGRASRGVAQPSDFLAQVVQAIPAGQTWVSYFIRRTIEQYGGGASGVAALIAAYEASSATNWEAQAALRGLTDLTISYASSANLTITAGAQLYALAVQAIAIHAVYPALFNVAPYTSAIGSWNSANVVSHKTYLATVA